MTPHDRYQRLIDLKGEIKQADDLVAECVRAEGEKLKAFELAEAATVKQLQIRAELYEEARRLAKEASEDFLALVPSGPSPSDPLPVDEPVTEAAKPWLHDFTCALNQAGNEYGLCTCSGQGLQAAPTDFWHPTVEGADFQAKALENGLARIHDALDRAT